MSDLQELTRSRIPKDVKRRITKTFIHKFKTPTFMDSGNKSMPRYKILAVGFTVKVQKVVQRSPVVGEAIIEFILENLSEKTRLRFDRLFKPIE